VFIDFENVYVSVRDKLDANPNFEMIMDRCEDFGRVVIARAYADWYRYPRVTSALYANAIEPMYVPTYYYDRDLGRTGRAIKNSVDMNLCIDAMKTLFTNPNIAKFVLATGDRDFIPLVNSIRQQGKEVIIIGIGGAASAHLAQSADEFIFYESLVGKKPSDLQPDLPRAKIPEKGREYAEAEEEERPPARGREREREREREPEAPRVETPTQPDIYDTLVSAINLARERGYVCSFGSLKLLMKELMGGDFKEGKYKDASGRPFAKFKDFVLEAERRGKVQVFTRGTVNEVFLPGEDPFKLSQFAQDIKEEPGAPVIQVAELDLRPEPRTSVAPNGRRRRRRSRSGQRPAGPPQDGVMQMEEPAGEEAEEFEEVEDTALPELTLPDLPDSEGEPVEETAPSEQLFEELLDRVEEEQAETEALAELGELEAEAQAAAVEPPVEEVAAEAPAAALAPEDERLAPEAPATQPFTDDEWRLLHEVVVRFDRPVSFVQIHDALRNARNSAGISRTNEELRSLIKQGINSGVLERIGKGSRASYRLAQQADQAASPEGEAPDLTEQLAPPAIEQPENGDTHEVDVAEVATEGEAPDLTEQLAPPAIEQPENGAAHDAGVAEVAVPSNGAPEPYTPEAAAQLDLAVATGSEGEAAEPAARRSRPRRKPAADAASGQADEPAKPKRSSRKPPAPAAEGGDEQPAKPKRSRSKKTETAQ